MAEAKKVTDKDEELEELLDSALEDFNKPPPSQNASGTVKSEESKETTSEEFPAWNKEFLLEAQKAFESNMKALFGPGTDGEMSPEQFGDHLQKIAEEANKVLSEQSKNDPEFSATIAQTLKNISDNSEKLQSEMGPDALTAMLGGLGLGTEEDSAGDFMPFMQSMMQSFLSKDVLYPTIKEIKEKYPSWLEEHKASLSEADYANYNKQHEIMSRVCAEFERESEDDSEDVKKERFGKIFSLMEEMQKLGQPPKELCTDENGAQANLPMDMSECSIM